MTKAPFLRRRRLAALARPRPTCAQGEAGPFGRSIGILAGLGLLFAFCEVTLYDLAIHPLASLGHLARGIADLIVTMVETLPYLFTAVALWLAGVLAWLALGPARAGRP